MRAEHLRAVLELDGGAEGAKNVKKFDIYRYDPTTGENPRIDSYDVDMDNCAPMVLDVVAQGERFRMALSDAATPDEVYQTVVWDGDVMLLLEGGDASRQEDIPQEERPTPFIVREGDTAYERLCPEGTRQGSAEVAGRLGTVYSCPPRVSGESETAGSELTLDDATGLLLSNVSTSFRMVAVEVETDVEIDASTFSTEIPTGSDGQQAPEGEQMGPLTSGDSVPLAGGGELRMEQIRQGPSLVVIGELPGVRAMLARLLPKTGQGTAPPVYVLLNPFPFDESEDSDDLSLATAEGRRQLIDDVSAQVRTVRVPVGIDIKGGAAGEELRPFEELMAGTTILAAIDEDGGVAWRLTDEELARSTQQLDEWVAENR